MLSQRMKAVYELVPEGGVADIGTDHGYLAAALARDGLHSPVVATDAAGEPLDRARSFARKEGLLDRIDFRLGDGLSVLRKGEVRTAVIAGLGGESICRIIEGCSWAAEGLLLVLQPMSRPDILRRTLFKRGYAINSERFVRQSGRIFCVMTASGGVMEPLTPAQELVGRLTTRDPLFQEYLEWVIGFTGRAAAEAKHSKIGKKTQRLEYLHRALEGLHDMRGETQK